MFLKTTGSVFVICALHVNATNDKKNDDRFYFGVRCRRPGTEYNSLYEDRISYSAAAAKRRRAEQKSRISSDWSPIKCALILQQCDRRIWMHLNGLNKTTIGGEYEWVWGVTCFGHFEDQVENPGSWWQWSLSISMGSQQRLSRVGQSVKNYGTITQQENKSSNP